MKINVIDEKDTIINWQKAMIFQLRMCNVSLKSRLEETQHNLSINYENGWKDAVKKIDNFIERHCKEYE